MPQKRRTSDDPIDGSELPGWPGYRTRPNRSGWDPIDSRTEAGHVSGVLLRDLFTLKARTRKPLYLALMLLGGVLPFLALVFLLIQEAIRGGLVISGGLLYVGVFLIISGAVTINFLLSILAIFADRRSQSEIHRKKPRGSRNRRAG